MQKALQAPQGDLQAQESPWAKEVKFTARRQGPGGLTEHLAPALGCKAKAPQLAMCFVTFP